MTPTPTSLLRPPGEIRNRFKLISQIDVGKTSQVYEAFDLYLERPVCLKIYKTKIKETEWFPSFMKAEIHALAKASLETSFLPKIYDILQEEGIVVMELIKGENFSSFITKSPPTKKILEILRHVAMGLKELHKNNLYHGDIKFENIIISEKRAVLVDLGGYKTRGSRPFQSPEQLNGNYSNIYSDIFSYSLLTLVSFDYNHIKSEEAFALFGHEVLTPQEWLEVIKRPKSFPQKIFQKLSNAVLEPPESRPTIQEIVDLFENHTTPARRWTYYYLSVAPLFLFITYFWYQRPVSTIEKQLLQDLTSATASNPSTESKAREYIAHHKNSTYYSQIVKSFAEYKNHHKANPIVIEDLSKPSAVVIGSEKIVFYNNYPLGVSDWVSPNSYILNIDFYEIQIQTPGGTTRVKFDVDFNPKRFNLDGSSGELESMYIQDNKLEYFALLFDCDLRGFVAGVQNLDQKPMFLKNAQNKRLKGILRFSENTSILSALFVQIDPFYVLKNENIIDCSGSECKMLWYFDPINIDSDMTRLISMIEVYNGSKVSTPPSFKPPPPAFPPQKYIPWKEYLMANCQKIYFSEDEKLITINH